MQDSTEQLEPVDTFTSWTFADPTDPDRDPWRFVWRGGLTVNVHTFERETDVFMFTAATDADYPTAADVLQRCREYMAEILEGVR